MKKQTFLSTTAVVALAMLAGASLALADDATATTGATGQATAGVHRADPARVEKLKRELGDRSGKVSASARTKAEARIDASAKEVDDHAATDGDAKVAARLAGEFDMTADAIQAEKSDLNASWGDLTIAHAIAANAKTDVTVAELMALKQGGMGWGQIAAGLDLKLGSVVSGVNAESQVARGLQKADGRVTPMSGPGARVGAGAGLGAHAGVGAGKSGAAAGVGVGAGVKVGGKIKP